MLLPDIDPNNAFAVILPITSLSGSIFTICVSEYALERPSSVNSCRPSPAPVFITSNASEKLPLFFLLPNTAFCNLLITYECSV